MTSLTRANGQVVNFVEADLVSTLNALHLSQQAYQLVNNVFYFRLGPGSGRLLLADASQTNRDLNTVFTMSYNVTVPLEIQCTHRGLSASYSLSDALVYLGRPAVSTLEEANMALFTSLLPTSKKHFIDRSENTVTFQKKVTNNHSHTRKANAFIQEANPVTFTKQVITQGQPGLTVDGTQISSCNLGD